MNVDPEKLAKTYYELKSKINKLESQRKKLRNSLFRVFDESKHNEIITGDIKVYRTYVNRFGWDESKLKPILVKKGLWNQILSPDNKKIKEIIESGLISEEELEKAKINRGSWYAYAKKINKEPCNPKKAIIKKPQDPNLKTIVITHLSVVKENDLSIGGLDHQGNPVRLILLEGIKEGRLFDSNGNQIIKPFSVLKIRFNSSNADELNWDIKFKPHLIRNLSSEERIELITHDIHSSVEDIFQTSISENEFIKADEGKNSVGTIKVGKIHDFKFYSNMGKYQYRLSFLDSLGEYYDLSVTDFSFRNYCNSIKNEGKSYFFVSDLIEKKLNRTEVYLRIGLNRDSNGNQWLQIKGLYSFPYYKIS